MSKAVIHEIAKAFPAMEEEQLASLQADIKEQGGIIDEIYTFKGEIIEGRSRHTACMNLGIEPKMIELTDIMKNATELDALRFARSKNLCRRHTDKQKLAISIAKLQLLEEKYRKRLGIPVEQEPTNENGNGEEEEDSGGDKAEKLAAEFGVNRSYIFQAKKILKEEPKLANEVMNDEISLQTALKELPSTKEKEKKKIAEAKAEAKEAKEAGRPVYDDRVVTTAIRELMGHFDERAKAIGQQKSQQFKTIVASMEAVHDAWKQWQAATT